MNYYNAVGVKRIPIVELNQSAALNQSTRAELAEYIMAAVAKYYSVTVQDMVGRSREYEIVQSRQVAMWFIHRKCGMSLKSIGRLFNRDHTTVIHSRHVINDQLDPVTGENSYKADIKNLKEML